MRGCDVPLSERYLEELASLLGSRGVTGAEAAEIIREIRELDPDDVGPADLLADDLARVSRSGDERTAGRAQVSASPLEGSIAGVPYDVRPPDGERVGSRWWDPRSDRVFVPRVWGIGWDLNFGAIAVRLGLIEPDAEDEPFARTPFTLFVLAAAVAVGISLAVIASAAVLWDALPPIMPVHWDYRGVIDRTAPRSRAFGYIAVMAGIGAAGACASLRRGLSPLARAGWLALGSCVSATAFAVWAQTLVTVFMGGGRWWLPVLVVSGVLVVPLGLLTTLARAGRAAEMSHDLSSGRREP